MTVDVDVGSIPEAIKVAILQHHGYSASADGRISRNDSFLANVILRSAATKNLVPRKKRPYVRRTRCFTSFSMTLSGSICFQRQRLHEQHPRDFSVAVARLARNDHGGRAIPNYVISNPRRG